MRPEYSSILPDNLDTLTGIIAVNSAVVAGLTDSIKKLVVYDINTELNLRGWV